MCSTVAACFMRLLQTYRIYRFQSKRAAAVLNECEIPKKKEQCLGTQPSFPYQTLIEFSTENYNKTSLAREDKKISWLWCIRIKIIIYRLYMVLFTSFIWLLSSLSLFD